MVDSWSNQNLTVYNATEATFTCVAGTASYATTLWTPTTRPVTIQDVWLRQNSLVDYPLTRVGQEEYDSVAYKSARGLPSIYFYNPGATTGTLYLYPTPDSTHVIHINGRFPLASALALATTISLPPGYEAALCDNLALELAPSFGVKDLAYLTIKAGKSKRALYATNNTPDRMATGLPGSGSGQPGYIRILGDT